MGPNPAPPPGSKRIVLIPVSFCDAPTPSSPDSLASQGKAAADFWTRISYGHEVWTYAVAPAYAWDRPTPRGADAALADRSCNLAAWKFAGLAVSAARKAGLAGEVYALSQPDIGCIGTEVAPMGGGTVYGKTGLAYLRHELAHAAKRLPDAHSAACPKPGQGVKTVSLAGCTWKGYHNDPGLMGLNAAVHLRAEDAQRLGWIGPPIRPAGDFTLAPLEGAAEPHWAVLPWPGGSLEVEYRTVPADVLRVYAVKPPYAPSWAFDLTPGMALQDGAVRLEYRGKGVMVR